MITSALAAGALAASLFSPLSATTNASNIHWEPVVRENIGLSYVLNYETKCPTSHIYVHKDMLRGNLPEGVTLTHTAETSLPPSFNAATKLRGAFFNWTNASNPYLSFDLKCTSDPDQALPMY